MAKLLLLALLTCPLKRLNIWPLHLIFPTFWFITWPKVECRWQQDQSQERKEEIVKSSSFLIVLKLHAHLGHTIVERDFPRLNRV